jgi:hypothetical protein
MSGLRCIELADEARAARLVKASNVYAVRRRRDGKVVEIQVMDAGGDRDGPHRGNPRRYSYDHESDQNPRGVWTLKHLDRSTRQIFRAAIDDCAA